MKPSWCRQPARLLVWWSVVAAGFSPLTCLAHPRAQAADTTIVVQHPAVPDSFSFAGEPVPLNRQEIREQFDRELLLIHSQPGHLLYIQKLAGRWFPLIGERLRASGIPPDFKYLCVAESSLQNLVSRAHAVGFWQFMKETAPGFRLEVSAQVDERYNVLKSTEAACSFFLQAYRRFGSWTAAAASYNCGQGYFNGEAAFQQTTYYYDLELHDETNKYIFRILSFKYLLENPEKFGIQLTPAELYAPYRTDSLQVTATIPDLARFARSKGTTYKMLRLLNPWLRGHSLPVRAGKSYTLLLPATLPQIETPRKPLE